MAAVSDKPWSNFSESDYTPEQYKKACLIDTGQGPPESKSRYKLPVLEPDGALNRNGVHAAAGGHGVGAVQGCSDAQRTAAAKQLVSMYKMDLNEDPPDSLVKMAGMSMSNRSADVTVSEIDENVMAPLEYRSASFGGVDFKERIITVIAAPYGRPACVEFQGGVWDEVYERGAFDSVLQIPHRIRVNREHDRNRTFGKVDNFIDTPDALVAEVRAARTLFGDEQLVLADEDCLSASVCFAVPRGGETLDRQTRTRHINRGFMQHLALVEDPAYKAAQVLSVRGSMPEPEFTPMAGALTTPTLDEALADMADILAWTRAHFNK